MFWTKALQQTVDELMHSPQKLEELCCDSFSLCLAKVFVYILEVTRFTVHLTDEQWVLKPWVFEEIYFGGILIQ